MVFLDLKLQENRKKTGRKPKENQKKPTSERRQMALSRGGAEGRTAGPLGFGPHLRPLCGPPLQQQHDFWSYKARKEEEIRKKGKKYHRNLFPYLCLSSCLFLGELTRCGPPPRLALLPPGASIEDGCMALSFLMFFSFHSHQPCPR